MNRLLITSLFVLLGSTPLFAQINNGGGRGPTGFGGGASSAIGQQAGEVDETAPGFEYSDRAGLFVGANANAQQGRFVGMGPQQGGAGAQNFGAQNFGGQNRGAFGNLGGFGARGQQRGLQGRGQPQGRSASTRVIRTTISVGFNYQAVQTRTVKTSLEKTFSRLGEIGKFTFRGSDISVIPRGRTVVLQGQVASARDRDLAARIARFEPGVSAVINELVVMDTPR